MSDILDDLDDVNVRLARIDELLTRELEPALAAREQHGYARGYSEGYSAGRDTLRATFVEPISFWKRVRIWLGSGLAMKERIERVTEPLFPAVVCRVIVHTGQLRKFPRWWFARRLVARDAVATWRSGVWWRMCWNDVRWTPTRFLLGLGVLDIKEGDHYSTAWVRKPTEWGYALTELQLAYSQEPYFPWDRIERAGLRVHRLFFGFPK